MQKNEINFTIIFDMEILRARVKHTRTHYISDTLRISVQRDTSL